MGRKKLPSADELRKHLKYDPETGAFIRLTSITRVKAGQRVDRIRPGIREGNSYCVVGVCGDYFHAHRLAWKIMTGKDPAEEVDHIDGNSLDNRWANLRAATVSQNQQNKRLQRNNRSGFKGVHKKKTRRKDRCWEANIKANGVWHKLGAFSTPEEAHRAVEAKRSALHGEFARSA